MGADVKLYLGGALLKINRKLNLGLLICLLVAPLTFGFARAYGKSGTATTTNATVTFTFNPVSLTACNDNTAGNPALYIDFTDGVATTADGSTNLIILAAECHTFTFEDKNVLNEFTVGVITASGTAAYRLHGVR